MMPLFGQHVHAARRDRPAPSAHVQSSKAHSGHTPVAPAPPADAATDPGPRCKSHANRTTSVNRRHHRSPTSKNGAKANSRRVIGVNGVRVRWARVFHFFLLLFLLSFVFLSPRRGAPRPLLFPLTHIQSTLLAPCNYPTHTTRTLSALLPASPSPLILTSY